MRRQTKETVREFSHMRRTTNVGLLLAAMLVTGIITAAMVTPRQALAQTTAPESSFINIASGSDFPYGINCSDPDYVYVTIFRDGRLAKIDKDTKAVLDVIDNPQTGAFQQGFYSIARDGDGNLWINERDNGKVKKYDPVLDVWTTIPIVEEIAGNPKVDYPQTYQASPNLIRIDENPSQFGFTTYHVSLPSFGGVVYANGFVYVGLGYSTSFHEEAFTLAGVEDLQFAGLAKIDPSTNEVTRLSIPGALSPTGLSIDTGNSNVMWITDQFIDKVYRYDLSTETVLETIELDADMRPRGIDNNSNYIFVALNKVGFFSEGNSEILRISKADTSSRTIIDTTAPNTESGTFTVFVVDNYLLWTDQSRHVGLVNLSNAAKTYETTSFSSGNHFGCLVGDEFWFAGKGSSVVGTVNISALGAGTESESESSSSRTNFLREYEGTVREIATAGIPSPDQIGEQSYNMYELSDTGSFGDYLYLAGWVCYYAGVNWNDLTDSQRLYIIGSLMGLDKEGLGYVPPEPEPVEVDESESEPESESVEPQQTPAERLTELNSRAVQVTAQIDRLGSNFTVEELRELGFDMGADGVGMSNQITKLFAELAIINAQIQGIQGAPAATPV